MWFELTIPITSLPPSRAQSRKRSIVFDVIRSITRTPTARTPSTTTAPSASCKRIAKQDARRSTDSSPLRIASS